MLNPNRKYCRKLAAHIRKEYKWSCQACWLHNRTDLTGALFEDAFNLRNKLWVLR